VVHADVIQFAGVVVDGIGGFSILDIPGRTRLERAPDDWPERLQRGSLNLRVGPGGYPAEFAERQLPIKVETLDHWFEPEFEIPGYLIGNNTLRPTHAVPRRGDGLVWRAELWHHDGDGEDRISCWAFRRLESTVGEQLEFVAAESLRAKGLGTSSQISARLHGKWRSPR